MRKTITMLVIKKLAGVTAEVNVRECISRMSLIMRLVTLALNLHVKRGLKLSCQWSRTKLCVLRKKRITISFKKPTLFKN